MKKKDVLSVLRELLEQVDCDCPQEYRTRHLKDAMDDARNIIEQEDEKK